MNSGTKLWILGKKKSACSPQYSNVENRITNLTYYKSVQKGIHFLNTCTYLLKTIAEYQM